jgi:hypothetical protein
MTAALGGVALGVLLLASAAQAFECPDVKPSASRDPAYARAQGPSRCEGFFDRTVSQPFIELVSLTRGPWPAAATAPVELLGDTQSPLRLVVQPQRSAVYYRMDALVPAGQALRWDPAPMLVATGLRWSELGFVAQRDAAGPPVLVPLTVGTAPGRTATAVIRVSVPVQSIAWRGYRMDGNDTPAWTDVPDSRLYAWQRLPIAIELPAEGQDLRVDVQAVAAADGRALPLLRIWMASPRVGKP